MFLLPGEHCNGGHFAASLANYALILWWGFGWVFLQSSIASMGTVEIVSPFEYLQDTKLVIRAGFLWWGREGLNSLRFTWGEPMCPTHILDTSVPPALFYERKVEKKATVLVRAGGIKQSQNLLLTSLLLWLYFGMAVRLCLVFSDELNSFRKWEAHSQHVSWTELLWDLRQKTCPDESWLWLSWKQFQAWVIGTQGTWLGKFGYLRVWGEWDIVGS